LPLIPAGGFPEIYGYDCNIAHPQSVILIPYTTGLKSMILFGILNDYVLRNLLRSSFAPRAKELGMQLHGMIYPDSFSAYRDVLEREIGMSSEPQRLINLSEFKLPPLERLAFRSELYRNGRVNGHTFRSRRRQSWLEQGKDPIGRLKLESAFIAGRIAGKLRWDLPATKRYLRELEKTDYVRKICLPRLQKLSPELFVSGGPETFYDLPWLLAAGLLGIPRAIWIRSWDNITSKIAALPDVELFLVWSDLMEQELRRYFPEYTDRKIIRVGALQFDGHRDPSNIIPREEFCRKMGLEPERPILLYCTGGPHICRNEHLVIHDLQESIRELSRPYRPQLLIRLHPYFWNTDLQVYDNIRGAAIWPRQEDAFNMVGGSTTGLLDDYRIMLSSFYHQSVNINIASTVTLDSAIFDRPIVNIAYDGNQKLSPLISVRRFYNQYDHYVSVLRSSAVDTAWDRIQLSEALRRALAYPERGTQERRQLVNTVCGPVDEQAGRCLADTLTQFLANRTISHPQHSAHAMVGDLSRL
jgi:hypothetical protein